MLGSVATLPALSVCAILCCVACADIYHMCVQLCLIECVYSCLIVCVQVVLCVCQHVGNVSVMHRCAM